MYMCNIPLYTSYSSIWTSVTLMKQEVLYIGRYIQDIGMKNRKEFWFIVKDFLIPNHPKHNLMT